ncbi:MAG: cell division protein FtsL [Gemmatimonadetes bacterium]|nr:cell division protein FtsL [Gemmatimonadota bacterium]
MAAARVKAGGRGRLVVGLVLLGFVCVASGVIWRRSVGYAGARALADLDRRKKALEDRRVRLTAEIADLTSREKLGARVEKELDMHVPPDSGVIMVSRKPAK